MDYLETLARWQELKEAIATLSAEEKILREGLFKGTFPNPVEGTNSYVLPDGRIVKGVYKIYRNPIIEVIQSLPPELRDRAFRWKPELIMKAYRELQNGERKKVDKVLEIKPGMASLEIIVPKVDNG